MCDEFLKEKLRQDRAEEFCADKSLIMKNYFQSIRNHSQYTQEIPLHVLSSVLYPKANLYYAFAEDIHAMERIVTASKFFEKEKFEPHSAPRKKSIQDVSLEDEVVNQYLATDPLTFVIFGKPGLNHINVASAIADAWNCILISPILLIRQEIDSDSKIGRYMERILRNGGSIGSEIVMTLIRRRIKMRDVRHRGYVIECLPFIPNDISSDYLLYSNFVSDTDYVCPEFCGNCKSTAVEAREMHNDQITFNNLGCERQFDYKREIPKQIDEMFTVWPIKPRIIIYLVCPKEDVASRSAHRYVDILTGNIFDENEFRTELFGDEMNLDDEINTSFDYLTQIVDESIADDRRLVKRISDMKYNIEMQCDLYERLALSVIDKWILAHNPQHVIRVDGRSSARRIFRILATRLCTLAFQPSILPKKMGTEHFEQDDVRLPEIFEDETDLPDELTKKSAEEAFKILAQREIVLPKLPWRLSAWNFFCPVELAQGRTIKGLPEHAVRFLNKIFFLSSQEALNLFVENPRTFLLPPNPRRTCKIAVFGPKYAGKSELSAELAKVFGGTVINVDEIVKELIKQREESNVQDLLELIDISVDEKADIIIENIKKIPDEILEDDLRRDGGYVVDGMYVNVEIWRKIIDHANIAFEDIVVLFENEPYNYLLNKFRSFVHFDDYVYEAEYDTQIDEDEEYRKSYEDAEWEYLEHLTRFESDWMRFEEEILEFRGNVIKCNLEDITDTAEYVISNIKRRFDYVSVEEKDEEDEILEEAAVLKNETANKDAKEQEKEHPVSRIDLETAERFLNCGYYFLSSFGRWCPVQIHTNEVPIQMFLPLKARGQIFPVVRNPNIYFLAGEEALAAFLHDPAKYLTQNFHPPILPLRISIIGPPKCGKTTLANRFAKTYSMKVITRGKALRHMLKYYPWTESARTIESQLRAGKAVSIESVMRAVEMLSIELHATSQGYVLDDCPSNRKEAEQLVLLGVQPMIVLDLKADLNFCIECLSWDNSDTRRPLNFSASFLSRRYANWQMDEAHFRDWLNKFSQNVIELDATKSKWYMWTCANDAVLSRFADILIYFHETDLDKVHRLKNMCVSLFEFRSRQSKYESYCPVCLFRENILKTSSFQPADSRGMIQFREYFYWICSRHMNAFIEDPLQFLPPVNTASLPEERPEKIKETIDVKHFCWARRLQVRGFCLVTYVDGLPDCKLIEGRADLGVILQNKVYLFCSEKCREKFLARHDKYYEMEIEFTCKSPPVELRSLSDLDFLERTVVKILIDAVNFVAARRPKIFGLCAAVSAAIYIGVYLKICNTIEKSDEADIYKVAMKRMTGRNRIIEIVTDIMKKKSNPYLPKYSDSRRVPVPDARFDYLCEYFKPASKVPAFLHIMDIAGLVKGASEGQGLGNNFLSHIGACDGIFHLCRAFEDDDVTHVEGDVDPVRDLDIISEELRLKDVEFLNVHLEKLEKLVIRGNDKKLKPEYDTLLKVKGVLVDDEKHIRFADWSANDIEVLNKYLFLTSKPIIYLVNLSEKDYIRKKNKWLIKIKEWVDKNDPGAVLIPFSGIFENKIFDTDEAERSKYFEEHKATSALDKIIVQGYKALQLQYFFTAGHDEVKAWTIQKGTKAPQAAGKIHTDFEKGFIMAEVMKFEDFKSEGSEAAVKAAGKYRQQGRNYVVEDGDIIFFKFNAGAGLKDAKKK